MQFYKCLCLKKHGEPTHQPTERATQEPKSKSPFFLPLPQMSFAIQCFDLLSKLLAKSSRTLKKHCRISRTDGAQLYTKGSPTHFPAQNKRRNRPTNSPLITSFPQQHTAHGPGRKIAAEKQLWALVGTGTRTGKPVPRWVMGQATCVLVAF